jgi:hypothetical protein
MKAPDEIRRRPQPQWLESLSVQFRDPCPVHNRICIVHYCKLQRAEKKEKACAHAFVRLLEFSWDFVLAGLDSPDVVSFLYLTCRRIKLKSTS